MAWADDINEKLAKHTSAPASYTEGCRMWTGAYTISKPGAPAYGIIFTMLTLAAKRRGSRVHILTYMLFKVLCKVKKS